MAIAIKDDGGRPRNMEIVILGPQGDYSDFISFKNAVKNNAKVTGSSFTTSKGVVLANCNNTPNTGDKSLDVNGVRKFTHKFERLEVIDYRGNRLVDWNNGVMTVSKNVLTCTYNFNNWTYTGNGCGDNIESGNPPFTPSPSCTTIETITIDANGFSKTTNSVLSSNNEYKITVSGTYTYMSDPDAIADAECANTVPMGGSDWEDPIQPYPGVLDLTINDQFKDWGVCTNPQNNDYEITLQGEDKPLTFRINDIDYTDNNGFLTVVIRECKNINTPSPTPPSCQGGIPGNGGPQTPDLNFDGCVDEEDLSVMLSCWGKNINDTYSECLVN